MPTATILGDTYQTVIMPDGKEWLAENLKYTGYGVWFQGAASNNGFGRYYLKPDALLIHAMLTDGWRLPTLADTLALYAAIGSTDNGEQMAVQGASATTWAYATGTNTTGFSALSSGYRQFGSWMAYPNAQYAPRGARWWVYEDTSGGEYRYFGVEEYEGEYEGGNKVVSYGTLNTSGDKVQTVRLVRAYTPPPATPGTPAESVQVEYDLALEWTEAADGTPIAYDDGAVYDSIRSTLTLRLQPSELAALESAWEGDRLWTIDGTGFLLGPTIDHTAGVQVRLESFQVDGPSDSSMSLFDATVTVLYGPMASPSAGSLALVMSRGVPYHSTRPGSRAWLTDGGGSDVALYGGRSTRSTVWYSNNLTTAQAADVVNALRTLRGSSTVWTATGASLPFGPGEGTTYTVWIPRWKILRGSNLTWDVEMEVVRNG